MRLGRNRPVILLTAFGPFPSVPDNASSRLLPRLAHAAAAAFPSYEIRSVILATEWQAGTKRVLDLLEQYRPAVTIHFGVSRRATGFTLESRAVNERGPTADACGDMPDATRLSCDGPAMLRTRLPIAHIAMRLRRRCLPVSLSRDAGRYLCNAALYHSLDRIRREGWNTRSGFVHLPVEIGDHRRIGKSRLMMHDAVAGGLEIIAASLHGGPSAERR